MQIDLQSVLRECKKRDMYVVPTPLNIYKTPMVSFFQSRRGKL